MLPVSPVHSAVPVLVPVALPAMPDPVAESAAAATATGGEQPASPLLHRVPNVATTAPAINSVLPLPRNHSSAVRPDPYLPSASSAPPMLFACDPRHSRGPGANVDSPHSSPAGDLFPALPPVLKAFDEGRLPACAPAELRARAESLGVRDVLMHLPQCPPAMRSQLLAACTEAGLRLMVPGEAGPGGPGRRPADIGDLLARTSLGIDENRVRALIEGRTVLVTGAGGSIGSVLCEEIARFNPGTIVLLDQSEFALYQADESFARRFPAVQRVSLVADVRRPARIGQILDQYRPAVVFHAAAYKHVPLLEAHNAWEALRNNVVGTEVLARAAMQAGVERFVLVSTDKAVNPVSVMGASKRMAEMVCQALQQQTRLPCFEIVRFGNVIGSAGSVIPLFEQQIRRGERLTVTHPDMLRYFMSVSEAARLLLQAATMGQGGEVFVMDMGEPLRLLDVARDMLRLAGHAQPDEHIDFIGLRPGERLFEELLAPGETVRSGEHPGLHIARARGTPAGWLEGVSRALDDEREPDDWRAQLRDWVPEYRPQG